VHRGDGPSHAVIMGVSGTGKSTVARALADNLGWVHVEGDLYHPPANISSMKAGVPLDDAARHPWLQALSAAISHEHEAGRSTVTSCSALKRTYRDLLRAAVPPGRLYVVHLYADAAVLASRLAHRTGHFMPSSLLSSQYVCLEHLQQDELGATVDVAAPRSTVAARVDAHVSTWLSDRRL